MRDVHIVLFIELEVQIVKCSNTLVTGLAEVVAMSRNKEDHYKPHLDRNR